MSRHTEQTEAISSIGMKVPKDQGLALGIFYSISLASILLAWLFLPPTIRHEEDEDKPKILKPEDAIEKTGSILTRAEEVLAQKEKAEEEKAKKEKGKEEKAQEVKSKAGNAKSSKSEDKK